MENIRFNHNLLTVLRHPIIWLRVRGDKGTYFVNLNKYFLMLNGFLNFLPLLNPQCVIHHERKHLKAGFVCSYEEKWKEFPRDFRIFIFCDKDVYKKPLIK